MVISSELTLVSELLNVLVCGLGMENLKEFRYCTGPLVLGNMLYCYCGAWCMLLMLVFLFILLLIIILITLRI